MNVEAYNLDSLRALVRSLQDENLRLKALLDQANVAYETADIFDKKLDCIEAYDPDQGGRILDTFITKELANQFFSMFWGRTDVYARRGAREDIFLSVITGGMPVYVPNSVERKYIVRTAGIQSGQILRLKKS